MPRYYFDTNDGETPVEDEEGIDLPGFDHARVQAQSALADMARDVVPGDGLQRTLSVRVRNETGKTLLRGALSLAVEIEP